MSGQCQDVSKPRNIRSQRLGPRKSLTMLARLDSASASRRPARVEHPVSDVANVKAYGATVRYIALTSLCRKGAHHRQTACSGATVSGLVVEVNAFVAEGFRRLLHLLLSNPVYKTTQPHLSMVGVRLSALALHPTAAGAPANCFRPLSRPET